MDPYLQTSTPDRPPRMRRIRLQSKSMKPSMTSNPSAVRNRQKIYPKSTPNPQKIHPKLPRYIFIFFFKYLMLHSISPHRPEGPSSPLPRCTTIAPMLQRQPRQLHAHSCSYTLYLDVTRCACSYRATKAETVDELGRSRAPDQSRKPG